MEKPLSLQLLPAKDYLQDLLAAVSGAKHRIRIITTIFHNDSDAMEQLVAGLCDAAERGVDVRVYVDNYTYTEPTGPWPHVLKDQTSQAYRAMMTERRLKAAGVRFRWLGTSAILGVMGRTHTKWSIVDTTVYSFGGVNVYQMGFSNTDYMFKASSASLSDTLMKLTGDIIAADRANHAGKNRHIAVDSENSLLFDGGIALNSIIYKRAITLAKQAKSITFVSQYCPTGRLATVLKAKEAKLYFNHWESASALNTLVIRVGMKSSKFETLYKNDSYLHAKFIIFTMADGNKVALTGSHNFQTGGVLLGTRELCLETTSSATIGALEHFLKQYIES